ncbi:MAG TPA: lipocalin-like domain-containing protein [bacterium]|nr:lipocalin-like domain-containing protein [bacterium]
MRNEILALGLLLGCVTGAKAADFAAVTPGRVFQFPRDHGAHPEFKTEWWYFTGHLQDAEGKQFGFQWTVFRSALRPPAGESQASASPWRADQIFLGHLALSALDEKRFHFEEGAARAAFGLAGAETERFRVWLPGFSAETASGQTRIRGEKGDLSVDLNLKLPDSAWLQGQGGYSPKSREPGKASYYYSLPGLTVSGTLKKGGREIPVQGRAWMDHEFGSGQLGPGQSGWDWMGLPLGNGEALMVYRLRDGQDPSKDFLYGGFFQGPGESQNLAAGDLRLEAGGFWRSPRSGGNYPLEWRIQVPKLGIDLKARAAFPDQELDTRQSTQVTYWEGSVEIIGQRGSRPVKSKGYLEMTGYARSFEQDL